MKHLFLVLMLLTAGVCSVRADATLVFNEIMYHPATNEPAMEWVELYNQLAVDLDVSGWSLSGEIDYIFPVGTRVPGRSLIVVAIDPAAVTAAMGLTNVLGPFTNRLSNGGGTLRLRNNNGRVMDEVAYGTEGDWPVAPDGAGPSLAKTDEDAGSADPANWSAASRIGGTPGTRNQPGAAHANTPPEAAALPVTFNEMSSATAARFWIELVNLGTQGVTLDHCVLARFGGADYREYVIPPQTLPAGGYFVLDRAALGFGAEPGDRVVLYTPGKTAVVDAVVAKSYPRARLPEGTGGWLHPGETTPGETNSFSLHSEIVINEILFRHKPFPSVNGLPAQDNPEEWIELYNRSPNAVDLTGWALQGAVRFTFPDGTVLAPGAYLVVAKDAAALRASNPEIDIVGDYGGRMSSQGELLRLVDASGNPADEVRFYSDGRWPAYTRGGGSSLELRDPNADNSKAEAWAASDESGKSSWQTYSYQMVAQPSLTANPDGQWRDFLLGLLAAGECLVDDIQVVQLEGRNPVLLLTNGDFEKGLTGWRVLGTHGASQVISEPGNPGNHVLHVVATGPQEHMHNHIETTLADGRSVVNGQLYEISYRARWVAGNSLLNTRLWFNRVARTMELAAPQHNGTPGRRNSRYEANVGPTFAQFQHQPVVPAAGEAVTISVQAQDPQGVTDCQVFWSVNGGAFSNAAMTLQPGGMYAGTVPGFSSGAIVQFYVRAVDALGAVSTFPARGADGGALYKVDDGRANVSLAHNIRIVTTPANATLLHADTNVMSNDELPCTVIYDERLAYYDVGLRLKASMNGRPYSSRVGFHLAFQPDQRFRGVHPAMGLDRRPGDNSPANEEIIVRHIALAAGGVPTMHLDVARVLSPRGTENGPALLTPSYEDEFVETAFENGGEGLLFEMEGTYYARSADGAGYKLPRPNATQFVDMADRGDDKEVYRYHYVYKNHRNQDDYRPLVALSKTFSLNGTALETQTRQLMDVDEWLRAYAVITLCGVNDTYTFWLQHNVMFYFRPCDHKAVYLMWDNDFSFARSATSAIVGDQNLGRIINLPANLRVLYAQMLDLMDTTYNTGYLAYWLAHYGPFSGTSYNRLNYIQQRTEFVKSVIANAGGNTPFSIQSTPVAPTGGNLVTLSGTAPVRVRTITVNDVAWPVTWASLADWTLRMPLSPGTNTLEIAGYDLHGRLVPNTRSSATATVSAPLESPVGRVVFNKIMFSAVVPDGEYVELHNQSTSTAFDLSNWRITELDYAFPPGSYLAPRSSLVLAKHRSVFALTFGERVVLFDEFAGALQLDGGTLTLIQPGALPGEDVVIDEARYEGVSPRPAAATPLEASIE